MRRFPTSRAGSTPATWSSDSRCCRSVSCTSPPARGAGAGGFTSRGRRASSARWERTWPACSGASAPASEGGGLFATIEGLLLLALIAAAFSGALWWLGGGSESAVVWRGHHIVAARAFAVLMVIHVVAVSLHLVDLVRD